MNSIQLKHRIIILISMTLLSSCEHLGPAGYKKIPLDENPHMALSTEKNADKFYDQQSNNITEQTQNQQQDAYYRGSGVFVGKLAKKERSLQASDKGKFSLNFEDAALSAVVKVILNDLLNESYMMNPKVTGKVTLQTSRPLTRDELLPTLELLLQVNNAALLRDKTLYRIEPLTEALQGAVSPRLARGGKNLPAGYQVRIMPLAYIGVEEMQEILKPIVSPKAVVRADPARNLLMLAGTGNELDYIKETIDIFDVDYMQGMSFGIFPLNNVDTETIKKELDEIFDSASGNPLAGMFKLMPIERLNALLVITPQASYLDQIKRWIVRLDKANSQAGGGAIVYRVQHIKATDLAGTLNEIFSGGGENKHREASVAIGRQAVEISNRNKKSTSNKKTPRAAGRNTVTNISGISDVKFIADEPNNAIIIVATAQQYETIRNVIKQLDVMPLQVLIDATIIAVTLDDKTDYGVTWSLEHGDAGDGTGLGVVGLTGAAASGGFSYAITRTIGNLKVDIEAAASKNNINVLSSPSLMVLNNQQATIKVGDQVPIRTSQSTPTSGGADTNPIQTSSIEMRDTGVTLTVTPRVNAGGVVIMDIEQSVDDASDNKVSGIDSPTITQRSIKSSVAVHSGETIVLGGLMSNTTSDNKSGIPFLMDIPYLGSLFSQTTRSNKKSELIVLLTPRVLANRADARLVTREYKQKLSGIFEDVAAMKKAEAAKAAETKAE